MIILCLCFVDEELIFSIDDLQDVYTLLTGAQNQWFNLGLALRIKYDILKSIEGKNTENIVRIREMLVHRLQMTPQLSLEDILTALKRDTVNQPAIAGHIAENYKGNIIIIIMIIIGNFVCVLSSS